MTTEQILKEIKERCKKATEGPWECERVAHDEGDFSYEIQDANCLMALYEHNFEKPMKAKFTAEFISASRTDVPWLVEALERTIEALKIIIDPSKESDFIQSLSPDFIANEALDQVHAILVGEIRKNERR